MEEVKLKTCGTKTSSLLWLYINQHSKNDYRQFHFHLNSSAVNVQLAMKLELYSPAFGSPDPAATTPIPTPFEVPPIFSWSLARASSSILRN